jgi:hypothetical protein
MITQPTKYNLNCKKTMLRVPPRRYATQAFLTYKKPTNKSKNMGKNKYLHIASAH